MLTGDYPPHSLGGTEIFVSRLVTELRSSEVDTHVVYHSCRASLPSEETEHVHVLPALKLDPETTYTFRPPQTPGFSEVLSKLTPDLVHMHSWGPNPSLTHMDLVKSSNIPLVVTHHVPAMTCMQRSLMYAGERVCDGEMRIGRCTRCRIKTFTNTLSPLHWIGGHVPFPRRLGRFGSARPNTRRFIRSVQECIERADRLHVFTDWARDVFLRNGADASKIDVIRTAIAVPTAQMRVDSPFRSAPDVLKLVYWGRIDRTKGLHVLIQALRRLPGRSLELLVVGAKSDHNYHAEILEESRGDARIRFVYDMPNELVPASVSHADLAVFPAIWLETGPLTVLEARLAGLPILGSDLGGIAELCREDPSSILIPPLDSAALAREIEHCLDNPAQLKRRRACVRAPRSTEQFASELLGTYSKALRRTTLDEATT